MESISGGIQLTDAEKQLIVEAAGSWMFTNSPVSDDLLDELRGLGRFSDFVNIPAFRFAQLTEMYGRGDILDKLNVDWAESLDAGAVSLFSQNTVTFAAHVADVNGYALRLSIRRSQEGRGPRPWYLCYVPDSSVYAERHEDGGFQAGTPQAVQAPQASWSPQADTASQVAAPSANSTSQAATPASAPEFIAPKGVDFYYTTGEYAYAQIEKFLPSDKPDQYPSRYVFRCIDGVSTACVSEENVVEHSPVPPKVGMRCWLQLGRPSRSTQWGTNYIVFLKSADAGNPAYLKREIEALCVNRRVGEVILAPIVDASDGVATVALGPNLCAHVPIPPRLANKAALADKVGSFELVKLDPTGGIELKFAESQVPKPAFGNKLPDSVQDAVVTSLILELIHKAKLDEPSTKLLADQGISLATVTPDRFKQFADSRYVEEREADRVCVSYRDGRFGFDYYLGIRTSEGVPISVGFKVGREGNLRMNLFGFTSASRPFNHTIGITEEGWADALAELADLAMGDEPWDDGQPGDMGVLKSYIIHTFYKAWLDGLIVEDADGNGVFCTGLVDENYDSVFCYLRKLSSDGGATGKRWTLGYFACWGKGQLGKRLNQQFDRMPPAPTYIDREHL